jgi:hypothetical protein
MSDFMLSFYREKNPKPTSVRCLPSHGHRIMRFRIKPLKLQSFLPGSRILRYITRRGAQALRATATGTQL